MALFTWTPDQGVTKEVTPRIKSTKFGNGYSQDVVDGMNPIDEVWPLMFSLRTKAEILAIDDFLTDNIGVYFTWVTPEGVTKKFVCKKWTVNYMHDGDNSLSATFELVYRL